MRHIDLFYLGSYLFTNSLMGRVHLCRVAGNTVWFHMAGDAL